jgi:hypothetical protein
VAAAFTLVGEGRGNLGLLWHEIALRIRWNRCVDAFRVAALAAQNPFRIGSHGTHRKAIANVQNILENMDSASKIPRTVSTDRTFIEHLSFVVYKTFTTTMSSIDIWRPAYVAAVCETDNSRMLVRIMEARSAIEQRLLHPIDEDSEEYRAIKAAQKALDVLKSERVDNIPRHSD